MKGMEINQFYDTNASDQERTVDVTNLSWSEKEEISKYTLALINSARRQMGKRNWTYRKAAVKFADRVAQEYYNDDFSCWQRGHDVSGIKRAARACGLNYRAGQVYEDESGLPYGGNLGTTTRTMYELKKEIYFNVKQMLFGGFAGRESDYQDASRYTEWEHAGDLLGLRSMHGYDAKTKYFGVSFSNLADQPDHISVHMIGVAKRYILNYKRFNK
jgi:SEC10/PgrA surface exclusion-like protein